MIKGEAIIKDNQTSLSINCEDCNVECFGGSDYEFIYTLDETNRRKLWRILRSKGLAGSMEDCRLNGGHDHRLFRDLSGQIFFQPIL